MIVYINQILIIYRQIFKSYFDSMFVVFICAHEATECDTWLELNVGFLENYSSSLCTSFLGEAFSAG